MNHDFEPFQSSFNILQPVLAVSYVFFMKELSLKPQRSKDSSSFSSASEVGQSKVTELGKARGLPFLNASGGASFQF